MAGSSPSSYKTETRKKICGIPGYYIGVISIVLVTLLWVGSSFLTKTILSDFDKPFFLTYISLISFQVYYIFLWIPDLVGRHEDGILKVCRKQSAKDSLQSVKMTENHKNEINRYASPQIPSKSPMFVGKRVFEEKPPLTLLEMAKLGFGLFVIYVAAAYLCNLSFQYTSVTSSTIMATTNGIFLLIIGSIAGTDAATYLKILSVLISASGAFLLIFFERTKGALRTMGNLMSLGSSACYALYSVFLKKNVNDESRVSIPILFAIVGTCSMILLWPILIVLHVYRIEIFQLPKTWKEWTSILVNVLLGSLLPNYLWNIAFMLTTPLVVAIGISFTVPITLISEYFYGKEKITWVYLVAGSMVVLGFLLINLSTLYPESDCDCKIFSSKNSSNKKLSCCMGGGGQKGHLLEHRSFIMSQESAVEGVHLLTSQPPKWKYTLGVISLILVVIGWVGTNFLIGVFEEYNKPFFVAYLSGISLQIYFMVLFLGDPLKISPSVEAVADTETPKLATDHTSSKASLPPLTLKETAFIGFFAYLLYFWSNYLTTMSFGLTSAGSASILASTCGFFTLLFGRIAGVEKLTFMRIVAVIISIGGVIVLGKSEFAHQDTKVIGNIFSLCGSCLYGIYSVYLKRATIDESRISMLTLFAFVGFFTMIGSWPFFFIFHYTGIEPFALPGTWELYGYIAINIIFGSLIPNYLWNVAFLYTSQLVVAIGLSFTIPLTLLGEYLLRDTPVTWYKMASAGCIMLGFAIVNLVEMAPKFDISFKRLICIERK